MSLRDTFRTNLKALQIYSKLNIFPVEFTKHGTAKSFESGYKRSAFYCIFLNAILYIFYVDVRFLQALTADKVSIVQSALHGLVVTLGAITLYWHANFFVWMESFTNMVLSELLIVSSCIGRTKGGMQERVIKFIPFLLFESTFISLIPYALEPDSPQTVYSGMSSYLHKSPFLMIGSMLYEYLTFCFLACSFLYSMFLQVGILESTQRELGEGMKELRRNPMPGRLLEHAKKIRRIQLRMAYFNKVFSSSIYILKLQVLFESTFGIFLIIRLWETYPLLAAFAVALTLADFVYYSAIYGGGFEIPSLVEEYRREIVLHTARSNVSECMEAHKIARSVPKVAVVVGQFYDLKRSSTADMGDFIVDNVVSLLVSFPAPIVF